MSIHIYIIYIILQTLYSSSNYALVLLFLQPLWMPLEGVYFVLHMN